VDDEAGMRELLEIVLSGDGCQVHTAPGVSQAEAMLQEQSYDCVLTDLRMGSNKEAGMQVLRWLSDNAPATPAIMMTAYGSVETAIEAMKLGAADYLAKPFKNDEVRLRIRRAIEQRDLVRENAAYRIDQAQRGKLDNIIGNSRPVQEVREMIQRVAVLPSTVAIHGESGTGKELVARGIHELSSRAERPFVAINCGAFPENLLESELFGHKKGSFTGAIEDKEGLFVVANGGTLFLDEIGEMPVSLQVKLLRVLDNGIVMPVGGTNGISVDVRIISATNRNLEKMAQEGDFREDLYYRLNVIPIVVPPLRERSDDIALLARHFIAAHARKMGREELALASDAEEALRGFRWPGNVRELENCMERAVALCRGQAITLEDLPQNVRSYVAQPASTSHDLPDEGLDIEEYIADIEIGLINQALKRSRFSQKRAARLLGLTPRSLRYRLQKYGLES
jgi:two-component system response regulator PilR (NtrC family)